MIRKIIVASALTSLALAAAVSAFADNTSPPTTPPTSSERKTVDLACMQTAVDKRDTAIIAGVDAYHTAVKAALEARKTSLKAAWGITDRKERRAALKTAWRAYRTALKGARKGLHTSKNAVWAAFKADRRTCGSGGTSDDQTGQGVDSQLYDGPRLS